MPPRFTYWTILLEGKPTAFRAHTSEELMPTLRQLQVRHPEAVMLWFARGRLWSSPEEERAAAQARRTERERRRPDWRPGGEHRDPRDRFKVPRDEKRRRFGAKLRHDRDTGPPPEPAKDKAGAPYGQRRPSGGRSPTAGGRGPSGGRGRGPTTGGRSPTTGGRGPTTGGRGPTGDRGGPGGRRGQPGSGSRDGTHGWNRDRGGRGRGNGGGRGGRGGK
jgi:hypothetical protein